MCATKFYANVRKIVYYNLAKNIFYKTTNILQEVRDYEETGKEDENGDDINCACNDMLFLCKPKR
jgi:hypothetical protein